MYAEWNVRTVNRLYVNNSKAKNILKCRFEMHGDFLT